MGCFVTGVDGQHEDKKKERGKVKQKLHDAFKKYMNVRSITDLKPDKFEVFMGRVRMIMCREYGVLLSEPWEDFDIEKIELREFLAIKVMRKLDYLPEGAVLINDLRYFYELRPGKKNWNDSNIRLRMGTTYYVYDNTGFYKRDTHPLTDTNKLRHYVHLGVVYMDDQDYKQQIENERLWVQ